MALMTCSLLHCQFLMFQSACDSEAGLSPCGDRSGAAAGFQCQAELTGLTGVDSRTDLFGGYYGYRVLLWYGNNAVVVLGVALVGFHGHAKLCTPLARVLGCNRGMSGERTLTMVKCAVGLGPVQSADSTSSRQGESVYYGGWGSVKCRGAEAESGLIWSSNAEENVVRRTSCRHKSLEC